MTKNICVITARGGSRGIPKKNILKICGKPLLHYSLETSFKAGIYEDIIVSSDDNEILDCARLFSKDIICVKRPENLSGDIIMPDHAVVHAIEYYKERKGYEPENTTFLHPTSPLRRVQDLIGCVKTLDDPYFNSCVSVHKTHYFDWRLAADKKSYLPCYGENRPRRQEYTQYVENGSIFVTRTKHFLANKNRLAEPINIFEIPYICSFQLDDEQDLIILESLISKNLV